MLAIREEQMAVFAQRRQNTVSLELVDFLREHHTETFQFYSKQQLTDWISNQIAFLAERQITGKQTVVKFIELFAIFGANFELSEQPDLAVEIINQVDRSEELRFDNILQWAQR